MHPGEDINQFMVAVFEIKQALGGFFVKWDPGEHGIGGVLTLMMTGIESDGERVFG